MTASNPAFVENLHLSIAKPGGVHIWAKGGEPVPTSAWHGGHVVGTPLPTLHPNSAKLIFFNRLSGL